MDHENYEFLTERLKYSGFEDKLTKDLLAEIQAQNPEFQLWRTMDIEGKKVDFDLYFKKSEISDRFNKMDVGVVNPNAEYRYHMFY